MPESRHLPRQHVHRATLSAAVDQRRIVAPPRAGWAQRVREARRIAQPPEVSPSVTDIPYRAISIFPTLLLTRMGLSPNAITVVWTGLGLLGIVLLGWTDYRTRLAGACLLQLSYLLDYVDGEVARLQSRTSKLGSFLDLVGHGLIKTGLFLGLGYYSLAVAGNSVILLLACSACITVANGHTLRFYAAEVGRRGAATPLHTRRPKKRLLRLLLLCGLAFESPGLYGAVLAGALLDRLPWVILFYGLVGPLWLLARLWHFGATL